MSDSRSVGVFDLQPPVTRSSWKPLATIPGRTQLLESSPPLKPGILLLFAVLPLLGGCMHRRVTIQSSPPGALVKVDGRDIGYTPASLDFTWYGTREVQLLMDGYETHTEFVRIVSPWYQKFPLDFVSDNFAGQHLTDHRQFQFQLRPKRVDVSSDVIRRADSLRSEAMHGR
jgi:PEGA domain